MQCCFFGSVAKTILITHWCFGCCWTMFAQCQGFLPPAHLTLVSRHGVGKRLGGHKAGTAVQNWSGDSPSYTVLCSAMKIGSRGRRAERCFQVPSRVAAARRLAGHWFACGRWWVISLMPPPCCFASVELPLSWPINFPVLLLYFTLHATEGGEGGTAASSSVCGCLAAAGISLGAYGTQAHTNQRLKPAF